MFVYANEILSKRLVHPCEGVTKLNHLLLDILSILLTLLLVSFLQDVLSILSLLVFRYSFKLFDVNIVCELFNGINVVEKFILVLVGLFFRFSASHVVFLTVRIGI